MPRRPQILTLLLLAILLAACNWPLSHLETEPLAMNTVPSLAVQPSEEGDGGYLNRASSPATGPATALVSPVATPGQAVTIPIPMASRPGTMPGNGGLFSGRRLRFDLPAGYRVLEALDGGCFLYPAAGGAAESMPGFLVLYPETDEPDEMLAELLNATTGLRRTEPPLEVDLGGLTFVGLFVETDAGSRLFLAAANGWALVVQGPAEGWPNLAAGLNQVLTSLSFQEGF